MFKYVYTKVVYSSKLQREIQRSSIVSAIDSISTIGGTQVEIYFKAELSSEDKSILDAIVENHVPTPDADSTLMTDGRLRVYDSPRPFGNRILYAGIGDNINTNNDVGGGEKFKLVHAALSGNNSEVLYCDFNTIENETYLYSCLATWKGMEFDELSATIVPRVTITSPGTNTNYNIYGGYLIVPAAGNGNVNIEAENISLIQVIEKEDGTITPGYWNANYNVSTHQFENITPALDGRGGYNMFSLEVPLNMVANTVFLNGSVNGWSMLPSKEADRLPHGTRLKISVKTNGTDHDWTIAAILLTYRNKTC